MDYMKILGSIEEKEQEINIDLNEAFSDDPEQMIKDRINKF